MATDLERLVVALEARTTDFERGLERARRANDRRMRQIEQRVMRINPTIAASFRRMGSQVEGQLAGFASRLGPLGMGMAALGPAGLTAAAGIGALVLGLRSGVNSAAQAETIFRRLDAVLKLAGNAAGMTAGEIDGFARELQRSTGIAANEINSAAAALATYTNISGERFTGIIKLSTDMVAVYGGNLREWSDKIARAIDDPVQGFAALRRAGFQLTDAQLDLVEGMRRVGDVAGYQTEMLRILSDSLGGAAGAQNQGMAGAATRAKNAVTAFLEEMARWSLIRGPVEATLNAISSGLEHVADKAERLRQIELSVGFNVTQLNRELIEVEDHIAQIESGTQGMAEGARNELLAELRATRDKLSAEMEEWIQKGHQEVADIVAVQSGERLAQWGAATDLINDSAKAAQNAASAYSTASERLTALGSSYEGTRAQIEEARALWKASAEDLRVMSSEEREAYEARGRAIEEWAAAEENAYQRQSAALQQQIANEGKRGQSIRETRDEVRELIGDLEHQLQLIGQSSTAQRISNELRRLGAKATQEQKAAIASLITEIDAQTEAQERANKAQEDFIRGAQQIETDVVDALGNVIAGTEDAADAFKKLAIEIVKSAITGRGAYSDFFASLTRGGGSGGFLSSLLGGGGFRVTPGAGLWSSGGYTGPGGVHQPAGVVHKGEVVWSQRDVARAGGVAAVEAMRLGKAGYAGGGPVSVMPNLPATIRARASAGVAVHLTLAPHIDNRGASAEAIAKTAQELAKFKAELPARVVKSVEAALSSRQLR